MMSVGCAMCTCMIHVGVWFICCVLCALCMCAGRCTRVICAHIDTCGMLVTVACPGLRSLPNPHPGRPAAGHLPLVTSLSHPSWPSPLPSLATPGGAASVALAISPGTPLRGL